MDVDIWWDIKIMFLEEIINFNFWNIVEIYFNLVFWYSYKGFSVDEDSMFVYVIVIYREFKFI